MRQGVVVLATVHSWLMDGISYIQVIFWPWCRRLSTDAAKKADASVILSFFMPLQVCTSVNNAYYSVYRIEESEVPTAMLSWMKPV